MTGCGFALHAKSVFWEAPAGVGFSYCNGGSSPAWNDTNTAVDNANFLCEFFALYPEYAGRDFYLTGESCTLPQSHSYIRLSGIVLLPAFHSALDVYF